MGNLLTDLRYAVRRLASAPGFTAVASLTLALGIGATTAIYSVVDALMLRPLPYADPERLVDLGTAGSGSGILRYFDREQVAALQTRTDLFSSVDGWTYAGGTMVGGDEPTSVAGAAVGGSLMRALGVQPQLGRLLEESDARTGAQVIVLSDESWRKRFGADPGIVGRAVRLDNQAFEVIGVMPASFKFPDGRREFWTPLAPASATAGGRPESLLVMARVRGDLTMQEARARIEASTVDARTAQGTTAARPLRIAPSLVRHLNPPVKNTIYLLAGAVAFVLLIACANIANLLLVQNASRYREVAVRTALGAPRATLIRQFMTESLLLAALGGVLGLLVAQWAINLLVSSAPRELTYFSANAFALDARVVAFAIALTTIAGVLCGVLPAVKGSRGVAQDALKGGGRSATDGPSQARMRSAFVVLQLAVSVVLLIGATLLARTFIQLTRVNPGFDARNLSILTLELPRWKYPNMRAREEFFNTLTDRVRALPGVTGVTQGAGAPPEGGNIAFGLTFEVEGRGVVLDDAKLVVPFSQVSADYFSVMGIPVLAGRGFSPDDVRGAPLAIVINQEMATRLWRGDNAVGQRLRLDTGPKDPWYTVVGVVGDVYQFDYAHPRGQLAYYFPISQYGTSATQTLVVRSATDPTAVLPLLRQQVRDLDPDQYIWKLGTVTTKYGEFFALPRFYTLLMAALAGLGVVIAAVGLYGVLAYAIAQRTREFGVRLALGAQQADILRMVLRSGAVVTAMGLFAGAAGSLFVTRSLESMLVEVPRLDPVTYAAVVVLLAAVALVACWIPARRATRVDPVVALRYE